MANIKFFGSERSKTNKDSVEVFCNVYDEIYIGMESERGRHPLCVVLDIPTAIQLSKQLRKSIASAKQSKSQNNG